MTENAEPEDLIGSADDVPEEDPAPAETEAEGAAPDAETEAVAPEPARVVRDLTARSTYAGATYPRSRVQVRADGTAALFVPTQPNEPLVIFRTDLPVKVNGGRGTAEDGDVTFAHRALGCGWPLCKARVPSGELAKRW